MKLSRLAGFVIAILIGITLGVVYGWVINPRDTTDSKLTSLRADYKADYVLMVSEGYAADGDIGTAIEYLDHLQPGQPLTVVQAALLTAQQMGYSNLELQLIAGLEKSLLAAGAVR